MWDDLRQQALRCSYCPNLCLHACPASNATGDQAVSPWAKMSMVRWMASGVVPVGPDAAAVLYHCTSCGACQDACLHRVDVPAVLQRAREHAVGDGIAPWSAPEVDTPVVQRPDAGHTRTVYVPGCTTALGETPRHAVVVAVLEALDLGPVAVVTSGCCGHAAWAMGAARAAERQVRQCSAALPEGATVLVGPGTCQHALVELAQRAQARHAQVRSALEAVAEALGDAQHPLRPVGGRYAVLDGCHHLRRFELAAAARTILDRICKDGWRPLRLGGAESWCCGAALPYRQVAPDGAARAARLVLEMARDAGADALVAFDPVCAAHLARCSEGTGIAVRDGLTLVGEALGVGESAQR